METIHIIQLILGVLLILFHYEVIRIFRTKNSELFSRFLILGMISLVIYLFIGYQWLKGEDIYFFLKILCLTLIVLQAIALRNFLKFFWFEATQESLLINPEQVRNRLREERIPLKDLPVFLVTVEKDFYWFIGKNLYFPNYMVGSDGEFCLEPEKLGYEFVIDPQLVIEYDTFFGKFRLTIENPEVDVLNELSNKLSIEEKEPQ
ncbi:MAG: hypothetical protein PHE89_01285 [Alphaproteobacteria bacterium]|nr:hypothetical protein [Alphaproteobacteria bacterium]